MNVSTELMDSYNKFKNKDVLIEMLNDLFDATRRVISPVTTNNSDLAAQFSEVNINKAVNLIKNEHVKAS